MAMLEGFLGYSYSGRSRDFISDFSQSLDELLGASEALGEVESILREDLAFPELSRNEIIDRFHQRYEDEVISRFPSLQFSPTRAESYAEYVFETQLSIEDYSEPLLFNNAPLLLQLQRLDLQLRLQKRNDDDDSCRQQVADMVLDLLQAMCLVPAGMVFNKGKHDVDLHFDYRGEVSRHWIQGLPCDVAAEVIKELRLCAAAGLAEGARNAVLLCDIDLDDYFSPKSTVARRIAIISQCNFYGPTRRAMIRDPLVKRILDSPQLLDWMICCSGSDEQYWLNTCEVAARNTALAARLPTLAHCMRYTRLIIVHLRENMLPKLSSTKRWAGGVFMCKALSQKAYCERLINSVEETLNGMELKCDALLSNMKPGSPVLRQALQQLLFDWNKATQMLSSVFDSEGPVVLSRKLFSENWQLSAKTIALPCILSTVLPGEPFVWSRNEGTPGEYHRAREWVVWRDRLPAQDWPRLAKIQEDMKRMTDEQKEEILNELWYVSLFLGGVVFASKEHIFGVEVGHLNILYAVRLEQAGRFFLVCDPEIRRYKWVTFADMEKLIVSPKVNFDLVEV